ncbi:hypothetical protein [Aggregatimonas sangjinii]|uniref:hypothetical protein n=1 Tax=Aggregatimonas sangjinii TaxID=2583587 RepID=UPI0015863F34|nr:hypothetical protein [Aggregatimonas sangjinii]
MTKKQGNEKTEFVKEEDEKKEEYIFQKNTITKTGTIIIIAFLILLGIGLLVSGVFFEN